MPDNELFDLIAAVAIYHHADVCFKSESSKALRKLQKAGIVSADWKLDGAEVSNWAKDEYDRLFEEIVKDTRQDLEIGRDYWGAKCVRWPGQHSTKYAFSGDSIGQFPWYETADMLIGRLADVTVHD